MKSIISAITSKGLMGRFTLSKEQKEWYHISQELKAMFKNADACDEVMSQWGNPTRKELLKMYTNNIKFCIEKNLPYLPYIRKVWKGKCEDMGIFVDNEEIDILNYPIAVCNGSCLGDISYNKNHTAIYQIYARHSTYLNITAENDCFVFVFMYGNKCRVKCTAKDKSKIVVFKYDDTGLEFYGKKAIIKETACL